MASILSRSGLDLGSFWKLRRELFAVGLGMFFQVASGSDGGGRRPVPDPCRTPKTLRRRSQDAPTSQDTSRRPQDNSPRTPGTPPLAYAALGRIVTVRSLASIHHPNLLRLVGRECGLPFFDNPLPPAHIPPACLSYAGWGQEVPVLITTLKQRRKGAGAAAGPPGHGHLRGPTQSGPHSKALKNFRHCNCQEPTEHLGADEELSVRNSDDAPRSLQDTPECFQNAPRHIQVTATCFHICGRLLRRPRRAPRRPLLIP